MNGVSSRPLGLFAALTLSSFGGGCAAFGTDRWAPVSAADYDRSPSVSSADNRWGGAWRDRRIYRGFESRRDERLWTNPDDYDARRPRADHPLRYPIRPIDPYRLRLSVGRPYYEYGRYWRPRHEPDYDAYGIAVWYGRDRHGVLTASGEPMNMHAFTAAHPTLALNSIVEVTNRASGRRVRVRINDRGPFNKGRMISVTRAAARELGFIARGRARVRVRYVGEARDYPALVRRGYPRGADRPYARRYDRRRPLPYREPRDERFDPERLRDEHAFDRD